MILLRCQSCFAFYLTSNQNTPKPCVDYKSGTVAMYLQVAGVTIILYLRPIYAHVNTTINSDVGVQKNTIRPHRMVCILRQSRYKLITTVLH